MSWDVCYELSLYSTHVMNHVITLPCYAHARSKMVITDMHPHMSKGGVELNAAEFFTILELLTAT